MTSEDLYAVIRARVGKLPSTESQEYTNTDVDREVVYVIEKVAERFPIKALRYVTSVEDQREYSVHADTLRVSKVFPSDTADDDLLQLGSWKVSSIHSNEYYNFPSMWLIKKQQQARALPRFRWEYDPINRKLSIDPMPDSTGDKYWYFSVEKNKWALDSIPQDFDELFVLGVLYRILEQIAMARSRSAGVQRRGGFVDYPMSTLDEIARKYKDDFDEELHIKSLLYTR